jgi:hypothetical protein
MDGTCIFQESLQLAKKMLHARQAGSEDRQAAALHLPALHHDTIFDALGSGGESPTESMLKGMTVESVEEKGLSKYLGTGTSGEGDGYDDAAGASADAGGATALTNASRPRASRGSHRHVEDGGVHSREADNIILKGRSPSSQLHLQSTLEAVLLGRYRRDQSLKEACERRHTDTNKDFNSLGPNSYLALSENDPIFPVVPTTRCNNRMPPLDAQQKSKADFKYGEKCTTDDVRLPQF